MSEFPPPKKNAGVVYGKNIDIDRLSPGLEKNCWTTNEQQISVENQDKNNLKENCDLVIGAIETKESFQICSLMIDCLTYSFIHCLCLLLCWGLRNTDELCLLARSWQSFGFGGGRLLTGALGRLHWRVNIWIKSWRINSSYQGEGMGRWKE